MSSSIDFSDLMKLINKDYRIESINGKLDLEEKEASMTIEIKGTPADVEVIHLKNCDHLLLLRDGNECRRICDYLLMYNSDGESRIIFIELKKTLNSHHYKEQLRRSLPILKYLLSVYAVHYEIGINEISNVKYILIAERNKARVHKPPLKESSLQPPLIKHKGIEINSFVGKKAYAFSDLER